MIALFDTLAMVMAERNTCTPAIALATLLEILHYLVWLYSHHNCSDNEQYFYDVIKNLEEEGKVWCAADYRHHNLPWDKSMSFTQLFVSPEIDANEDQRWVW